MAMPLTGSFPATSMPDRDWWATLWPDPESILRSLGVRPGTRVLDLCCGDGYFTAPLAKLVGGQIYALDLDAGQLDQARAEVARQNAPAPHWICADARDVADLVPEPLDYVLMANTFHGVPDQARLACAVADILKPNGLFGIVNWHALPREQTTVLAKPRGPKTSLRMPPAAVQAVVEAAGFRLVRLVELPPYHYGITFERTPAAGRCPRQ